MMVPAVVLGALAVFFVVYFVTSVVLVVIADLRKGIPSKWQSYLTKKNIDDLAKVAGGVAVVMMVLLLFVVPKEWFTVIWIALTAIGVFFGLLTFALNEPKTSFGTGTKHKRTVSTGAPPFWQDELFRTIQRSKDELYRNLLAKTRQDKNLADRLIEYERKRMPRASQEELIRSAIERWERDNR